MMNVSRMNYEGCVSKDSGERFRMAKLIKFGAIGNYPGKKNGNPALHDRTPKHQGYEKVISIIMTRYHPGHSPPFLLLTLTESCT